jgi:hypothetical protein
MSRRHKIVHLLLFGAVVLLLLISCPFSNTILIRPILAQFDSRYVTRSSHGSHPFDRARWKTADADTRVGMAQHLAETKSLDGLTLDELTDLLGPPDINQPGDEGVRWLLGFSAKGLFDEVLWLQLTLDDGRARGAGVGVDWNDPRK